MKSKYISHNEQETVKLGANLSKQLKAGDIVCLFGDLGSGKTTFVKGIGKGLKINPIKIHSPTFTLMNFYQGRLPVYHFDFYRIEKSQEILGIGYEEYFYGDGLSIIEWPERLGTLLPKDYLNVKLSHRGKDKRLIEISKK